MFNAHLEDANQRTDPRIEEFLIFAQAELRFRPESLTKYRSCLRQIHYQLSRRSVETITKDDLLRIKARFVAEELSDSWLANTVLILKRFLQYCRDEKGIALAIDPDQLKPPKRRRKEVAFLTPDEIERFVGSIRLANLDGTQSLLGLRFRALVELLLGSGLRISEALSLDRGQINFETHEAKIIGKGGAERVVFFTDRALRWLKQYLEARTDLESAMFANHKSAGRMRRPDTWRYFAHYRSASGITKRFTAHTLRHTAATQLLFNGCPIGHIKEILGHARLETTCRYYLGVDHRAAKQAHEKFLVYSNTSSCCGPVNPRDPS